MMTSTKRITCFNCICKIPDAINLSDIQYGSGCFMARNGFDAQLTIIGHGQRPLQTITGGCCMQTLKVTFTKVSKPQKVQQQHTNFSKTTETELSTTNHITPLRISHQTTSGGMILGVSIGVFCVVAFVMVLVSIVHAGRKWISKQNVDKKENDVETKENSTENKEYVSRYETVDIDDEVQCPEFNEPTDVHDHYFILEKTTHQDIEIHEENKH